MSRVRQTRAPAAAAKAPAGPGPLTRSQGVPLPDSARGFLERRMGVDLASIRIHADAEGSRFAHSLGADAATVGRHVYMGRGAFDPRSDAGRELLAHEVWHSRQDGAGETVRAQRRKRQQKVLIGVAQFFDDKGSLVTQAPVRVYADVLTQKPWNLLQMGTIYPLVRKSVVGHKITYEFAGGAGSITWSGKSAEIQKVLDSHHAQLDVTFGMKRPPGDKPSAPKPVSKPTQTSMKEHVEMPIKGLGIIELDMPVGLKKLFAFLIKIMVDAEEIKNLNATLQGLKSLGDIGDELEAYFRDPKKLLEIVLGLEPKALTPVLSVASMWVNKPMTRKRKRRLRKSTALRSIARKIIKLVGALRVALRPLFWVREGFIEVVQLAAMALSVPGVRELWEFARGTGSKAAIVKRIGAVGKQGADELILRMRQLAKSLSFPGDALKGVQLITPGDIAAALSGFMVKAVKAPHLKVLLIIAEKTGALAEFARRTADLMIPKSALAGLNKHLVGGLVKLLGPVSKEAGSLLGTVVDKIEPKLRKVVDGILEGALIRRAALPGGGALDPEDAMGFAARSSAEPLPGALREDMSARLGRDLTGVRIHRDDAAAQAAHSVAAKAFTVGRDIYFGRGRFDADRPEGRGLIAHELMHVLQRGQGAPEALRRASTDQLVQGYLAKMKAKLSMSAKLAFNPSPASQKRADAIIRALEKYVLGKPITRRSVQRILDPGYVLVRKRPTKHRKGKQRKIKSVRRRARMLLLLPPLTLDRRGLVRLNLHKPFNPDRRALWAAMRCNKLTPRSRQAHHIIPLQIRNEGNELVKLILNPPKLPDGSDPRPAGHRRWEFNGQDNGICLPVSYHYGSHGAYTSTVRKRLNTLWVQLGRPKTWSAATEKAFVSLVRSLRRGLQKRRFKMR